MKTVIVPRLWGGDQDSNYAVKGAAWVEPVKRRLYCYQSLVPSVPHKQWQEGPFQSSTPGEPGNLGQLRQFSGAKSHCLGSDSDAFCTTRRRVGFVTTSPTPLRPRDFGAPGITDLRSICKRGRRRGGGGGGDGGRRGGPGSPGPEPQLLQHF